MNDNEYQFNRLRHRVNECGNETVFTENIFHIQDFLDNVSATILFYAITHNDIAFSYNLIVNS